PRPRVEPDLRFFVVRCGHLHRFGLAALQLRDALLGLLPDLLDSRVDPGTRTGNAGRHFGTGLFQFVHEPVARLLHFGHRGRLLDAVAALDPDDVAAVTGLDRELGDEEGDDAQEEEQAHGADVAHPASLEVFAGQVAGPGEQRPDRARRARIQVEHAVEEVADDAAEVPDQAMHRLSALVAMRPQQLGAAVLAGRHRRGSPWMARVRLQRPAAAGADAP